MDESPARTAQNAPRLSHAEPSSGDVFAGRYRIEELLGRGANGAVWSALDEAVGDRIALKLLVAGPSDAAERFRREVRLARRVTHRNAARIFDLGQQENLLYLTMELVEGESLEARLREGRLDLERAVEIARQVAVGLQAAHEVDVVHRDIKPGNVLLERGGRVVLTDFGVARALASDVQLTRGSAMIGSPAYMAPEQVRGEEVSAATDLYALGCVLYEMLTGRCPFVRDGLMATALARLQEGPEDPRTHASLPDELAELVITLLAVSPADRPTSAQEVARSLEGLATRAEVHGTAETLVRPSAAGVKTGGVAPNTSSAATGGRESGAAGRGAEAGKPPRSASSTFISIAPHERTLAVLPARYRGPEGHSYLADGLAEDMVDALSATRGTRVTATGATAKYQGKSIDPREAGREIGVDAIVDTTARFAGERFQISARLVDVATGEQLWLVRFDVPMAQATELPEITAQRIVEGLRGELEVLGARHRVPNQAVDRFLAARHRAAVRSMGDEPLTAALEILEEALEIAPDFELALATHAEYAVRRWFLPADGADQEVTRRAHESVVRALRHAGQLPLSHFAAGRLAVSDGRFPDAANELTTALQMAPTYAAVHDYLGALQCEAGRGEEGERHIVLARRLNPSLPVGPALARRHALADREEEYEALLAEMKATPEASRFMIESLEMRVAGWRGDRQRVARCRPASFLPHEHAFYHFMEAQRAGLLGEGDPEGLMQSLQAALETGAGPRLDTFSHQLAIEALVPLGALAAAFGELRLVASAPSMVDTEWMERCPALEPLRDRPEFAELTAAVRRRADAIWRVSAG